MPFQIRQVRDPQDAVIERFGALQEAVYPEPDMLIPARYVRMMLDMTSGGRRNFLLVAEDGARLLGAALFHLLTPVGSGFSSFLGVARAARGTGVARALHRARLETLDSALGKPVAGVFIDVVNPLRLSPEELEAEWRVGSDPWTRRKAFRALGFRQLDVRYEQPVGGPDGGPVTNMDLLFYPHAALEGHAEIPTDLVADTLRTYWNGWLGEQRAARHARELRERAGGQTVALIDPVPAS
ncbi:GNAT superfamily N-acetyltransferase [Deinobacterium chartae]|uniref:GNAT superfamily N-acetyltransferase n=1 Tax=Deinobacterium chartae TaxID=521158 RepID=A0A841I0A4_9DEIO|nr:GNAT family N-acetyltransferase [Deinobacterium chartae]MBB6098623.1 GNAT superfamily N-acetyltransferase [Deinobacterium chartae]